MAQRRITAEEATLRTATVEIKTIQVSGKQMTLAVFRQLLEEQIIGDDGSLRGEPWGLINYHSGVGCDKQAHRTHLHAIWQKGDELRRSCVFRLSESLCELPGWDDLHDDLVTTYEHGLWAMTAEGWHPSVNVTHTSFTNRDVLYFTPNGLPKIEVPVRQEQVRIWQLPENYTGREQSEQLKAKLRSLLAEATDGTMVTSEKWDDAVEARIRHIRKLADAYRRSFARLEALDQLFIAV